MPEENILPLEIEDKVNHPELEAMMEAFGSQFFLSAEEFNRFKEGVNQLYTVFQNNAGVVNDATPEIKGILQLTNDLGGTATNPTVPTKISKPIELPPAGEILVIAIDENGNTVPIPTKEVFHVDQIDTPYNTINDLVNTGEYSTANGYTKGTQIICPGVIPPRVYLKTGDNDTDWLVINGATLPLE
ncbi:MAG: hypothetical protein BM557_01215 [Flavobacterium sp. MedPE-SWcel]|uniref:hypothetical protein n=1 Tax=uncultured Flavobacterium sp. TaxID=165435 RepID=UPI0009236327|nr:hypothetical protein [uncultured Flavobacterium sp.]OIQ22027.1 MAG: hypothetical protein BM557_01215 [Flavobacterium sp. MedPE-SWcel]